MHMDNRPFHFLTLSFLLRLFTSNCPIDHAQLASEVDVREFLAPPQVADVFEEDIDSDYSLSDSVPFCAVWKLQLPTHFKAFLLYTCSLFSKCV